ncbi:MAG TPA: HAD-IIIC family phosphatase [Terriglobales bacterium]|nr:HAD-IIIC family phosphatase [Terriglobales bacterium]
MVIRVHRNHAFEHVGDASVPWFAWWGRAPKFLYSDYDDSLSFAVAEDTSAHLEVIWLDLGRYHERSDGASLHDWIAERIAALRARLTAPILFIPVGAHDADYPGLAGAVSRTPGARMADLRPLQAELGADFFDTRAALHSGTNLSDAACILVARELACRWAPALLRPRIKAVALDLDQTLFAGVLGEDHHAVHLTAEHAALQRRLAEFRSQGIFLALVSRNDLADVRRLFEHRSDFPLQWDHFSAAAIGWQDKAESLRQVARTLNIGEDAILFVDDNAGEIANAAGQLPGLATLHAQEDASMTRRALEYYPGLWSWGDQEADNLRIADLAASQKRLQMAAELSDPAEYLRSLGVELKIEVSPARSLVRCHQLSQKTNQFNLNLQRLSEAALAEALGSRDSRVVLISLADRLADSGPVGLLVAQREGDALVISELAISCRALGRRLEDLMVAEAVHAVLAELPASRVEFLHRTGPRNAPARDWLMRFAGPLPDEGRAPVGDEFMKVTARAYPVTVTVKSDERSND